MKIENSSYSFVIIAKEHNPTVISPDFLKDTKMIESDKDFSRDNMLITPMISKIDFTNGCQMLVEKERFEVKGTNLDSISDISEKYYTSLPHIHCLHYGFNIILTCSEIDLSNRFNNLKLDKDLVIKSFILTFVKYEVPVQIVIALLDNNKVKFNFNFDYILNDTFANIKKDIKSIFNKHISKSKEIIENF